MQKTADYILLGTDINNCSNQDTVTVNVLVLPIVTTGSDEIICINDSVQLSANGANTYLWNPSNTITDNTISNPTEFPTT